MAWSDRWPPEKGDALDADLVINEVRAALAEREALVPAGFVPSAFNRWDPLVGEPEGKTGGQPNRTMANFQHQVEQMLLLTWPYRWWDPNREALYGLANLCQDAFGKNNWTHDLTDVSAPWTPAAVAFFDEVYRAINRLDHVRILPTVSEALRRDSVYRLMFGISDWPQDRADTFALFDGQDDGVESGLAYDVGMGGEVYDDGFSQQWFLESREFQMTFATAALAGCQVRQARLDFTTEAPSGSADYSDTFTAEVVDGEGNPLDTFASDDYGPKTIPVPAAAINTGGDTVLVVRSARPDSSDRPAWDPSGPDYTSTYREGLAVAGPVRLIVEVDFEYRG